GRRHYGGTVPHFVVPDPAAIVARIAGSADARNCRSEIDPIAINRLMFQTRFERALFPIAQDRSVGKTEEIAGRVLLPDGENDPGDRFRNVGIALGIVSAEHGSWVVLMLLLSNSDIAFTRCNNGTAVRACCSGGEPARPVEQNFMQRETKLLLGRCLLGRLTARGALHA